MKKLFVIATVAFAAFYGQAASVDWMIEWSYSSNSDKGVNTFDDSGNYTYWVVALGGSSTAGLEVDADGNLVLGSGMTQKSTGSGSENFGGSLEGYAQADNGNYLALVIYDAANGLYGISGAVAISGISDDPPKNADYITFSNDGGANADSTPYMMANLAIPTSGGVPEPTSGLLLLIGGSLLALRRKQK